DTCEQVTFTPDISYGIPDAFLDSVRWEVVDGQGGIIFASVEFYPTGISIGTPGNYTLSVTAYNGCGSSVATEPFALLAAPSLDISLDTNFVCRLDSLGVVNNSTGDSLSYSWAAPAGISILDPDSPSPTFVFDVPSGNYTISVVVGNPVCESLEQSFPVRVSEPPEVALAPIGTFCEEATFTPVATYSDTAFIDSIRWIFPNITLPVTTSDAWAPGPITIPATGNFEVMIIAYNGCGADTAVQTVSILEPIVVDAELSEDFSCEVPFTVTVNNLTLGDSLSFEWTVDGPFAGNVTFDPVAENPTFVFPDTGVYIIMQRVFNGVCEEAAWQDTVQVMASPVVSLEGVGDFCENALIAPGVNYNGYRIDSVRWSFPMGMPETLTDLYPAGIMYSGAGTYIYAVTAFNACGAFTARDTFVIDTIPEIILGPTDTICIYDGVFELPPAQPPGGFWTGPGIDSAGLFDPSGFPGGQTVTVTYNYVDGECFASEDKDIYVADPSYVDAGPDLEFCASDDCLLLQNGMPASLENGWYVGPGITDSAGVFCPQEVGGPQDVTVAIVYYYQEPGTECIGADTFLITVYALPVPGIGGVDSLCVDVPVTFRNTTTGGFSYEWFISDGSMYTDAEPTHTFTDTGWFEIKLIATSQEGCTDSTSLEVFVSGPPEASFVMDTTMGCAILPVTFTNTSVGYEYVEYQWDFGYDGQVSNLEQPGTIFYDQGTRDTTYYITLTVQNHCGVDAFTDSVLVFPQPLPDFVASQYSGCSPLDVAFNNFTLGNPDSFLWDLGNGITSTDSIPPDQVYLAEDSLNVIYTVTLYAFNECGV
ncbi:MAG: hypothetical protein KDD10_13415, partial [Phaeodactylibacter sp.]|nr:hypothetical protein [Phaeodactylibacter sp.]